MKITKQANQTGAREDDGAELLSLLEAQRGLVNRLADLAEGQGALIASSQADALLGLLQQRQGLVDQFTENQRQLGPMTERFRSGGSETHSIQRDRIRELLEEISGRIHEVLDRDQQDQESMKSSQVSLQTELSQLGTTRQARSAYLKPPVTSTRFSDQRG